MFFIQGPGVYAKFEIPLIVETDFFERPTSLGHKNLTIEIFNLFWCFWGPDRTH